MKPICTGAWHVSCTIVDTECLAPPGHGVLRISLLGNVECVVQTWVGCLGRKGLLDEQARCFPEIWMKVMVSGLL